MNSQSQRLQARGSNLLNTVHFHSVAILAHAVGFKRWVPSPALCSSLWQGPRQMEMFMAQMEGYRRNQQESQAPRERRIAMFVERVEELEATSRSLRPFRLDWSRGFRKPAAPKADLSLAPISVAELSVGRTHAGRVLYCRTVTRCMFFQSVATLVEDGDGQLSSLAVYNAPRVTNIWEAQAWLPEGTSLAIVEPFFKLRADGTPGIRVDDPKELVHGATHTPPGPAITVEERLRQLSEDASLGYKRACKLLAEEGHSISQSRVRVLLADLRRGATAGAAGAGPSSGTATDAGATEPRCSANGSGSAASPVAGSKVEGVLPLQARVRVEGLQSEAGKALNGCEGSVASYDFAAGRVGVDVAGAGRKLIRAENLRLLSAPSAVLPTPCGQKPSLRGLCSEGRWHEALVLAFCKDTAFLSHTMRAFHPHIWQSGISRIRFIHSSNQIPFSSNV